MKTDEIRACRIHRFGPPEVVVIDEVPKPSPGPGEVLVTVEACGVGNWDVLMRTGKVAGPDALPLTLGAELAGTVAATGRDVVGFAVGDAVYGSTNPDFVGAHADAAVTRASMLARRPRNLGVAEAAATPIAGATALEMVFDIARVVRGDAVLILGAVGSVGGIATTLALAAGARVVGVVRAARDEAARRLAPAEVVVGLPAPPPSGFDAAIDTVGGELARGAVALLRPGGRFVSAVAAVDASALGRADVDARHLIVEVTSARLDLLRDRLERGELAVPPPFVLPLAAAREAHALLDERRAPGKIVLMPAAR